MVQILVSDVLLINYFYIDHNKYNSKERHYDSNK